MSAPKRIAKWALVVAAVVAAAIWWRARRVSWGDLPSIERRVVIVDYTVPFDNYREHGGLVWLLGHYRVTAPGGAPSWLASRDYVGYDPLDRANPRRVSSVDLSGVDTVFVADTYGVYRDDLVDIANRRAHMDYSKLEFGGLSVDDARTLERFVGTGGQLICEFNSFATPTGAAARQVMETLHGVRWSEWVGRVFADPADRDDVPAWLPREFARQFPDRPYPTEPSLVLVSDTGELRVFSAPTLEAVTPRIRLTADGVSRIGVAGDAPYYFWFDLVSAKEQSTTILARFEMPDLEGLGETLAEIGTIEPPVVIERQVGDGRAVYLTADLADTEIELGDFDRIDAIEVGRGHAMRRDGPSSARTFWNLYAPLVEHWLEWTIRRPAAGRRR